MSGTTRIVHNRYFYLTNICINTWETFQNTWETFREQYSDCKLPLNPPAASLITSYLFCFTNGHPFRKQSSICQHFVIPSPSVQQVQHTSTSDSDLLGLNCTKSILNENAFFKKLVPYHKCLYIYCGSDFISLPKLLIYIPLFPVNQGSLQIILRSIIGMCKNLFFPGPLQSKWSIIVNENHWQKWRIDVGVFGNLEVLCLRLEAQNLQHNCWYLSLKQTQVLKEIEPRGPLLWAPEGGALILHCLQQGSLLSLWAGAKIPAPPDKILCTNTPSTAQRELCWRAARDVKVMVPL